MKKWFDSFREWFKQAGDPHYAYLCDARDLADLERRIKQMQQPRDNVMVWVRF